MKDPIVGFCPICGRGMKTNRDSYGLHRCSARAIAILNSMDNRPVEMAEADPSFIERLRDGFRMMSGVRPSWD